MIRFKKDDGSNYPERKEITFDELAEYKKGPFGSALKKEIFVPKSQGTVKVYEQQNAIGHDWKLERYFITKDYFEKMKSFEIHAGDIIVSCAGTIGEMYILPENAEKGVINQALMRVRENKEIVNQNYFMMIFDQMLSNEGKKLSNGSALKNIPPFADLKKQKVLLPCLEEQQKIADFLSSVDDVITASEQEVAALEEQKKGAMQKIFSQEVRFKADDGSDYPEWEELKLEDCCNGFDNQRKPVSAAKRESGNVPYYGANGIQDYVKDYIFDGEYVLLAEDGGNFDDFATRPIAQYISGKAWVNNHAHVIQAKENSITKYIFYTLVHKDIRKYINGTSRSKLNQADMWMIQIPVPRLEEQQKIADFLSDFDTASGLAKQELEQWKEFKKGLLQQLFE